MGGILGTQKVRNTIATSENVDYECFIMISSVSVIRLEERKWSELLKMNLGLKNSLSNLLK